MTFVSNAEAIAPDTGYWIARFRGR